MTMLESVRRCCILVVVINVFETGILRALELHVMDHGFIISPWMMEMKPVTFFVGFFFCFCFCFFLWVFFWAAFRQMPV